MNESSKLRSKFIIDINHDEYLNVRRLQTHFKVNTSGFTSTGNECSKCKLCEMKSSHIIQDELKNIEKIININLQRKLEARLPLYKYDTFDEDSWDKNDLKNFKLVARAIQPSLNQKTKSSHEDQQNLSKKRFRIRPHRCQRSNLNSTFTPTDGFYFPQKSFILNNRLLKAPLRSLLDDGNPIHKYEEFKACLISEDFSNRLSKLNLLYTVDTNHDNAKLLKYRSKSSNCMVKRVPINTHELNLTRIKSSCK